ncbi:MAG: gliding motility lipoprotein GldJ [Candidatus Amoebophilus sp.]
MKNLSYFIQKTIVIILLTGPLAACGNTKPSSSKPGKFSTATGMRFNQEGGFQVTPFKKQAVGPRMVFIEGGTTTIGVFGEDVKSSPKRRVTVTSFYLKETEVTNIEWQEYLHDLKENYSDEEYKAALPNEQVWVSELGHNDPYVYNYSNSPGFYFYPVVGVSWSQAKKYCDWLTAKLNLQKTDKDQNVDNSQGADNQGAEDKAAAMGYRLPTEAEWEYAALAMVGTQSLDFVQDTQRVYPWGDGLSLRGKEGEWKGKHLANFKRAPGNYKGLPGESNSSAPTTPVYHYPANDFGLYDMGGNVSEWVSDIYRPLSFQDFDDFNPIRRDDTLDPEKDYDQNNSLINNRARVYKGASWKDCAYWAKVGARRFLDQDSATATIGFRYAMSSMGGDKE